MEKELELIFGAVLEGNRQLVESGISAALGAGIPPDSILSNGLIAPMAEVGARFERGEFYVPEMLVAARAMQTGLALLRPKLSGGALHQRGKVIIGTVRGDLHDIGKNLVAMMLEGAGFAIVDLGVDVQTDVFVSAVAKERPLILGLSALLTTTMNNMRPVLEGLEKAGLRSSVKVICGGAPVTEAFARDIGADGYAPDASRAATLAKSISMTP